MRKISYTLRLVKNASGRGKTKVLTFRPKTMELLTSGNNLFVVDFLPLLLGMLEKVSGWKVILNHEQEQHFQPLLKVWNSSKVYEKLSHIDMEIYRHTIAGIQHGKCTMDPDFLYDMIKRMHELYFDKITLTDSE